MYLKSLVLKGFKSFADRSVLRLEPGLSVVVGPNGSGKSNISDAVLWVLGEQSAKQLRGSSMEDVIFAGSSARQAVGLAEVDLVLDNSDNTLPLDFNEVVITRRMYRSGESEYLINGSPARRMDVLDILNDSGMGRDAHSIISQGSLQSVLQAHPEDKRVLIEEAAGILKHKMRKNRAARKLKGMDAELDRVYDIAKEIDRQLKPLKRQASRAQQHQHLSEELREADLSLAVDDLRQLQSSWDGIALKEKEADSLVEMAKFRLEEKNKELEKYQRLLEEKGLFVGDLAEQRRRSQLVLQRLDSGMLLLEEKGRNMVSRLSELRQTIHRSDTRLSTAQKQLEEYEIESKECSARHEELHSQLSELQHQCEGVRKQRKAADEKLAKLSSSIRSREKAIEAARVRGLKANETLSTADAQQDMLIKRSEQIDESLNATKSTLSARRIRMENLEAELSGLNRNSKLAKSDIEKRLRLLDDARKKLDEQRESLASLRAELKGLEEIDRAFDETSPLLTWTLDRKDEIEGILAPLSEIFTASERYEKLVEHLLGSDLFGLMMQDKKAAVKLMARILESHVEGGEIALLPLSGVPGAGDKADDAQLNGAHAAQADVAQSQADRPRAKVGKRLLDELEYDAVYEEVAQSLLGDVYVVGSAPEAILAQEKDESGSRFVTEDGVVVWPDGKITIGAQFTDTEGVLGRKRRMNVLREECPKCEAILGDAEMSVSQAEDNLAAAQADEFELQQQIAQNSGELDSLREEAGRLEQNITSLLEEQQQLKQRREKIIEDSAEARELAGKLDEEIKEYTQEKDQLEEELAQEREKRENLFEEENSFSTQVSSANVELATVRERSLHLSKQLESLKEETRSLRSSSAVSHDTERSLEILRLRVEPLHSIFSELHEGLTKQAEILRDQTQLEQAGQGDLRTTIENARKAAAKEQKSLDSASEDLAAVRIEKGKLEVQVENAITSITDKHGVLLDIALQIPEPKNRVELEQKADKLRNRIAHLGAINSVAIEEYRSLKERRDFITTQTDDLEGARKALKRIVSAIDRKMRNRFVETFNAVNENFQEIFSVLFPGGKGHLELLDPSNPEESGVLVHAQPRGKVLRKQSLLSGGEQSLVALALLFATYKVRATPFYILDEVEAALDDTNLRRLLSYLDEMRKSTQFIMISHQRRTMEMADLLYGVSMRNDGVSKLVSQRLDQALRQAQSAPVKNVDSFSGAQ